MAEAAAERSAGLRQRIWFYVNFDCNLSCGYCVSDSDPRCRRPRLDLTDFRTLVEQAAEAGFRQAALTGGEPFLHPDILPMLEYATSRLDTVVLTNATLFGSHRLAGLADLPRDNLTVQVSLDAAGPRVHDLHRGKGCWERTVQGLDRLLEWDFEVAVRATVAREDEADAEGLRGFLRGRGVPEDRSYAMPVVKGGRAKEGLDLSFADLQPEPTVAADGLYWHPLKIARCLAVARDPLPLGPALDRLAEEAEKVGPGRGPQGYR